MHNLLKESSGWLYLNKKANLPDMTVREFCLSKNVTQRSYWYFHKKLADEMEEMLSTDNQLPAFLEVRSKDLYIENSNDSSISKDSVELTSRNITIRLNECISDSFLERIMRALNNV